MITTDTPKKFSIKRAAGHAYMVLLWVLIVANAYADKMLPAFMFVLFFAMNLLHGCIGDIATAIRTRRNFHIIGDANEINLSGSTLYADSVSVAERSVRRAEVQ